MIGALVAAWVGVAWGEDSRHVRATADTIQEGPWQVKVKNDNDDVIVTGWVWGSPPVELQGTVKGDPGTTFFEYFSPGLAGYFLQNGRKWSISAVSKSIDLCTSEAPCLRTKTTVVEKTDIYPTLDSVTTGYYVPADEYHHDGHYTIAAKRGLSNLGTADYYLSTNGSIHTEHICYDSDFRWPKKSSVLNVSWVITYANTDTYSACPQDKPKHHHVSVDHS